MHLSRGVDALAQFQASLLSELTPAQLAGLQDSLAALRGRLAEIGQEQLSPRRCRAPSGHCPVVLWSTLVDVVRVGAPG